MVWGMLASMFGGAAAAGGMAKMGGAAVKAAAPSLMDSFKGAMQDHYGENNGEVLDNIKAGKFKSDQDKPGPVDSGAMQMGMSAGQGVAPGPMAPRPPLNSPVGRGRPGAQPSSLMQSVSRPAHFDAGFFPDGGTWRAPMLPESQTDDTDHFEATFHVQPGETVNVQPASDPNRHFLKEDITQSPMASGRRPYERTYPERVREYAGREARAPNKVRAALGAAFSGGNNFFGNYQHYLEKDRQRGKQELFNDVLKDYANRSADRNLSDKELEDLDMLSMLHTGKRYNVSTPRMPSSKLEYPTDATMRRSIFNRNTGEYEQGREVPRFAGSSSGGVTNAQEAQLLSREHYRKLGMDATADELEEMMDMGNPMLPEILRAMKPTAAEMADPQKRAAWERLMQEWRPKERVLAGLGLGDEEGVPTGEGLEEGPGGPGWGDRAWDAISNAFFPEDEEAP